MWLLFYCYGSSCVPALSSSGLQECTTTLPIHWRTCRLTCDCCPIIIVIIHSALHVPVTIWIFLCFDSHHSWQFAIISNTSTAFYWPQSAALIKAHKRRGDLILCLVFLYRMHAMFIHRLTLSANILEPALGPNIVGSTNDVLHWVGVVNLHGGGF